MEQEQILTTLNERLGQTSLSSRTISEYVAENIPSEGQEFDYDRHVKILKSLNGNFSADMKKAVEDFKKNYKPVEQKTKESEPEIIEKTNTPEDDNPLLKRIESLEKLIQEIRRDSAKANLLDTVLKSGESFKVINKNLWRDCVNSLAVEEKDSADNLIQKAKASYEQKLKDYFGEGAAPYAGDINPAGKNANETQKAAREAYKAKLKARGKL